jgi:hypothetical protein
MDNMAKSIFIIWARVAPRSKLLTEKLGIDRMYLVHSMQRKMYLAPLRYLLQTIKTIQIFLNERPGLIFIQNPPIIAVGVVYFYSPPHSHRLHHRFTFCRIYWQTLGMEHRPS